MRLGGSLQRRRGSRARKSGRKTGAAGDAGGNALGSRLWATAAGLGLFGWVAGYVVATQVVFPAPPPPRDLFEVPDLRGLGLATAGERLAGIGLSVGVVDSLRHPSVARGLILGQSPLPGQLATPVTPVRVTISDGPQTRGVPEVVGLDADRARIVLETSGFVVRLDSAESELPRGRVVRHQPRADTVVALPSQIRLVVSKGPPLVAMPLVLGMTEEDARQTLDSLGLVVTEVREVFRFGRDRGIVVEQEPAAATELERGAAVNLAVGRRGRDRDPGGNNDPPKP